MLFDIQNRETLGLIDKIKFQLQNLLQYITKYNRKVIFPQNAHSRPYHSSNLRAK